MKKIFTLLSFVMLFALTASAADDGYRRTWDFREGWSVSTLELMAADTKHWAAGDGTTGFQNTSNFSELKAVVTYNGEDIPVPELEGITLGGMKNAAHVQIHPGKEGTDNPCDQPCLWINGKRDYDYISFTVPAGENVRIGYCTHKGGDKRGFKTSSAGFADADGNTQFTTELNTEIVEVELINSNTEESTLKLSSTSGHHIYYIIIGEGDVQKSATVGYLYSGTSMEEAPLYNLVKGMNLVTFKGINVDNAAPAKEELMALDAVVIDGGIVPSDALLASLKENIYWQPVVNFNKSVAVALGFGENLEAENEYAWAVDPKHEWLEGFENYGNEEGTLTTITNGTVLSNPLKLTAHAKAEKVMVAGTDEYATPDSVIAYIYNAGHNAYNYYGVAADYADGTDTIMKNIIATAIASKAEVSATPAPSFKGIYKQDLSYVVLSCLNKNAKIYYTVDGSEPTTASTLYAGDTLQFTQPAVINAIAVADGYTMSEMNTFEVKLYNQAKMPTITVEGNQDKGDVKVVLSSEDEGVDIWYNFTGSADSLKSTKYDGPITLKYKAEITAFAISDSLALVQSDLVTDSIFVNMKNVRRDIVAHFSTKDAGYDVITNFLYDGVEQTAWANTSKYYFSWGKVPVTSYENGDQKTDENGEPLFDDQGNPVFETTEKPIQVAQNKNDSAWSLTSQGQAMIYQTNTLGANIGNGDGYNPERAEDYIGKWGTNADVQLGEVAAGDKSTAAIRTNNKYFGPFNVIAVVANAVGGSKQVAVQISKDGTTWETVGDVLQTAEVKRLYKTFEVAYDGTDEVYVRLASISGGSQAVHDIYILNCGEKSQAEMNYYTGIEDVNASETVAPVKAVKMIKDGKIVIVTAKGTFTLTGVQVK